MTVKVITNNVPRFLIDGYELSEKERADFDYLNWRAIDEGTDSATFFRYKGQLYDMGNFMRGNPVSGSDLPERLKRWDGYESDSAFSATVVRYADSNCESVIVGRVLA